MKPTFFPTPEDFRQWLSAHHETEAELWVGFYKKSTKIPSINWPESVDQALCFGWIDGIRKTIDEQRYMIRFTPRNPGSHWSAINIKKMAMLKKAGLMQPSGLAAYKKRKPKKSARASYEQGKVSFPPEYLKKLASNAKANDFINNLAPGYRKTSFWYVMSAKQESTRLKRLELLISCAEQGLKIPQIRRN